MCSGLYQNNMENATRIICQRTEVCININIQGYSQKMRLQIRSETY